MCDPMTMMIVAGGTTALKIAEGHQAAAQQTAYHNQNKQAALQAMGTSLTANSIRQDQEYAAASDQAMQRRIDGLQALSSARVSNSESGITGVSIENIMNQIQGNTAKDVATINQNRDWTMNQLQLEAQGIHSQAQSRINSVRKGVAPNPLMSALKVGLSGAQGYASAS